jgi:hypothetical protein
MKNTARLGNPDSEEKETMGANWLEGHPSTADMIKLRAEALLSSIHACLQLSFWTRHRNSVIHFKRTL